MTARRGYVQIASDQYNVPRGAQVHVQGGAALDVPNPLASGPRERLDDANLQVHDPDRMGLRIRHVERLAE